MMFLAIFKPMAMLRSDLLATNRYATFVTLRIGHVYVSGMTLPH